MCHRITSIVKPGDKARPPKGGIPLARVNPSRIPAVYPVFGRCLWLFCLVWAGAVHAALPPNILLLVAEDLSPRIGSFGDPVARTPNIDALAQSGIRFTNVFTTAGVCAPSRAALITGLHQISFGAQHMRSHNSVLGEYFPQHATPAGSRITAAKACGSSRKSFSRPSASLY